MREKINPNKWGPRMIRYKKRRRYKYTLMEEYSYKAKIKAKESCDLGVLAISPEGILTIRPGYAWDGPSGPTIDTRNFMRGSLVHDALYQLMREQKIDQDQRLRADEILRDICLEAGMSRIRAWWVFKAVRLGAANAAKPNTITAP
jgi:hypothetical protein